MIVAGVIQLVMAVTAVATLVVLGRCLQLTAVDEALVIHTSNRLQVRFGGGVVIPVLHRAEVMSLRSMPVVVSYSHDDAVLRSRDDQSIACEVVFYVRVKPTRDDVVAVAQAIGCARASDPATVAELFTARFSEAVKTVVRGHSLEELRRDGLLVRDGIVREVGNDLGGFVLDDLAVVRLDAD